RIRPRCDAICAASVDVPRVPDAGAARTQRFDRHLALPLSRVERGGRRSLRRGPTRPSIPVPAPGAPRGLFGWGRLNEVVSALPDRYTSDGCVIASGWSVISSART